MDDSSIKASIETARRPISEGECRRIYDIHLDSLSNDVMPNFGYGVERRYLRALSEGRGAIVLARVESQIVGFLLLRFDALEMTKFLSAGALAKFLVTSFVKPKIFVRLIYQLIKATPNPHGSAEIDYFAVDERYRGGRIGEKLVAEAERLTLERGLHKVFTKTNNERLRRRYVDKKGATSVYCYKILEDTYHGVVWDVNPR